MIIFFLLTLQLEECALFLEYCEHHYNGQRDLFQDNSLALAEVFSGSAAYNRDDGWVKTFGYRLGYGLICRRRKTAIRGTVTGQIR